MTQSNPEPLYPANTVAQHKGFWLRALDRVQLAGVGLMLWMALFLPPNVYGLVLLILLLPIWGGATVIGLASLLKRSGQRSRAIRAIVTFPIGYAALALLSNLFGLPLFVGAVGNWLFLGGLAAYPGIRLVKWLNATAQPKPSAYSSLPALDPNAKPASGRSNTLVTGTLCLLWLPVLLVGLLLLLALASNDHNSFLQRILGNGTFEALLATSSVAAVLLALVTLPYVMLSLVRGVGRLQVLGLLTLCTVTGLCQFAIYLLIGAYAVG